MHKPALAITSYPLSKYGTPSVKKFILLFYAQKTRSCIFVVKKLMHVHFNTRLHVPYWTRMCQIWHACANIFTHVQNGLHMIEEDFIHSLLFAI